MCTDNGKDMQLINIIKSVFVLFASGRIILTIAISFIFCWMVVHDKLSSDFISGILSAVIVGFYFSKDKNILNEYRGDKDSIIREVIEDDPDIKKNGEKVGETKNG